MEKYELEAPIVSVFFQLEDKNPVTEYTVEHVKRWADHVFVTDNSDIEQQWFDYSCLWTPTQNVYTIVLNQWDMVVDASDMKHILRQERNEPRPIFLFQKFHMWEFEKYRVDGVWAPSLYKGPFPFIRSKYTTNNLPYETKNSPLSTHVVSRVINYKFFLKENRVSDDLDNELFVDSLVREPTLARWVDGGIPREFGT